MTALHTAKLFIGLGVFRINSLQFQVSIMLRTHHTLCLSLILLFVSFDMKAAVLVFQGAVDYRVIGITNRISGSEIAFQRSFTAICDTNRWKIQLRSKTPSFNRPLTSQDLPPGVKITAPNVIVGDMLLEAEWSFDGTNTYSKKVYDYDHVAVEKERISRPKYMGITSEKISIFTNEIPFIDETLGLPVWFALCSHHYFSQNDEVPGVIWWLKDLSTTNELPVLFKVQNKVVQSDVFLLPQSIILSNQGFHPTVDKNKRVTYARYRPPFQDGFNEASYSVNVWATNNTIAYPAQAVLNIHSPKKGANSAADTIIIASSSLVVTSAFTTSNIDLIKPEINPSTVTKVTDFRTRTPDNQPAEYVTTNKVVEVGDPQMAAIIKRQALASKGQSSRTASAKPSRIPIYAVLVVLIITPLCIWNMSKKIKTKNTNQNT